MDVRCNSLEKLRENIDLIDRRIVALLAERGRFVNRAAAFKKSADDVRAPKRVEQVIAKVQLIAQEQGANPNVVEAVYRAMIAAFIEAELQEHSLLNKDNVKP